MPGLEKRQVRSRDSESSIQQIGLSKYLVSCPLLHDLLEHWMLEPRAVAPEEVVQALDSIGVDQWRVGDKVGVERVVGCKHA